MTKQDILKLFSMVKEGEISPEQAAEQADTYIDFGDVKVDSSRMARLGFDEVIYGRSKSITQIQKIAKDYSSGELNFICTGLDEEKSASLSALFPDFEFNIEAGIMKNIHNPAEKKDGHVSIITAGTSDIHVAAEAYEIVETCGFSAKIFADIGVAGIHRFFSHKDEIKESDVVIVIAGMEGALPSVTGGIFPQPIIAVPTSTGYGTALNGFTAMFSMLSSCANGITVVNIDNGFGAAMAAIRILNSKLKS
jgi:NCAIR mutase (PurE)-related protein